MLTAIHPKLPMRNLSITKTYYKQLGFQQTGGDYPDYLMMTMDAIEIHFFLFESIDPLQNDGMVYIRTNTIDELYNTFLANNIVIHPNGPLETKPWGQKEFSLLDPDNNLLTFGESI